MPTMKTRGPAKKTSDTRPAKRPALDRSSSLSPPPEHFQESNANASISATTTRSGTSDTSVVTLSALAQNYAQNRDEVMELLLKLTKALKEERDFRDTLLSRVTEIEKSIKAARTKEKNEMLNLRSMISAHDSELVGIAVALEEPFLADNVDALEYNLEGLDDRVKAIELQLSDLKMSKPAKTRADALAAVEDQFALHQSLSQQQRQREHEELRDVGHDDIEDGVRMQRAPEIYLDGYSSDIIAAD